MIEQDYVPFGIEWKAELKKTPKDFLIEQLRTALMENQKLEQESKTPIHDRWSFIAMNVLPQYEGKYYVMDKFGNQGWVLFGNSGAPNENTSFFDNEEIKAKNIICWMNVG